MKASVIMPTYKGAEVISNALNSLARQSFKDFEVIIVVKSSGDLTEDVVSKTCEDLNLEHEILMQKDGYFTRALNIGLRRARGEILLFTDDDAIFPNDWIENYLVAHSKFRKAGAISGSDIPYQLDSWPTASATIREKMVSRSHWTWQAVRSAFSPPHNLFRKYRLGIYITRSYEVRAGLAIPFRRCLSLPGRGVNMSYKKVAVEGSFFPENDSLKVGPNNEQYFAVQLVIKGWESIYDPSIQVLHLVRTGLSKSTRNERERETIRCMIGELLAEYH